MVQQYHEKSTVLVIHYHSNQKHVMFWVMRANSVWWDTWYGSSLLIWKWRHSHPPKQHTSCLSGPLTFKCSKSVELLRLELILCGMPV